MDLFVPPDQQNAAYQPNLSAAELGWLPATRGWTRSVVLKTFREIYPLFAGKRLWLRHNPGDSVAAFPLPFKGTVHRYTSMYHDPPSLTWWSFRFLPTLQFYSTFQLLCTPDMACAAFWGAAVTEASSKQGMRVPWSCTARQDWALRVISDRNKIRLDLQTRVKDHERNCRLLQPELSATAERTIKTGHKMLNLQIYYPPLYIQSEAPSRSNWNLQT